MSLVAKKLVFSVTSACTPNGVVSATVKVIKHISEFTTSSKQVVIAYILKNYTSKLLLNAMAALLMRTSTPPYFSRKKSRATRTLSGSVMSS